MIIKGGEAAAITENGSPTSLPPSLCSAIRPEWVTEGPLHMPNVNDPVLATSGFLARKNNPPCCPGNVNHHYLLNT